MSCLTGGESRLHHFMRGFCLVPGHGASAHMLHVQVWCRTDLTAYYIFGKNSKATNCMFQQMSYKCVWAPRTWMSSRLSSWGLPQLPPLPGTSPYEGSCSAAPSLLPALLASWRLGMAPLLPPPPLAPDAEPVSLSLDSPPSSSCATC
jgi:hypothetical protein